MSKFIWLGHFIRDAERSGKVPNEVDGFAGILAHLSSRAATIACAWLAESADRARLWPKFSATGTFAGKLAESCLLVRRESECERKNSTLDANSLFNGAGKYLAVAGNSGLRTGGDAATVSRTLVLRLADTICSHSHFGT